MKALLPIFAAVVVLVSETCGQSINGEIKTRADGSVLLSATLTVTGNRANDHVTYTWTLPDGSILKPGERRPGYETGAEGVIGRTTQRLLVLNGHTSSKQVFIFRAQARWWWRTFTYTLNPRTNTVSNDKKFSSLTPETEYNSDGSVSLLVTVSGGDPAPDRFQWTLPGGSTLIPGRTQGSFRAAWPRVNGDGSKTYKLDLFSGLTSSSQSVRFRVEASGSGGWWRSTTFNLPAKTNTVTSRQGSVHGALHFNQHNHITIDAEVIGGHPAPNTYVWTVQNPDGSFTNYQPGSGPASRVTTNGSGNPSTRLFITSLASRSRTFKLRVSSVDNGRERWWASRTWNVGPTA